MKGKHYFIIPAAVVAVLIGGWFILKHTPHTDTRASAPVLYTCPMHPQIIQDAPGVAPYAG